MALRDQLRVLVVDDMSTSRGLLSQALDAIGIAHVATASGGPAALRQIARAPVNLVISDYGMPGMDGLQLLRALWADAATARTGFLLLIGKDDRAIAGEARQLGLDGCLEKPFSCPRLRDAIEAIVGRL